MKSIEKGDEEYKTKTPRSTGWTSTTKDKHGRVVNTYNGQQTIHIPEIDRNGEKYTLRPDIYNKLINEGWDQSYQKHTPLQDTLDPVLINNIGKLFNETKLISPMGSIPGIKYETHRVNDILKQRDIHEQIGSCSPNT